MGSRRDDPVDMKTKGHSVETSGLGAAALAQRYADEKQRRLRPEGNAQYVDLGLAPPSTRLSALADDPWADDAALDARPPCLRDGDHVRFLIIGAGYGGLLYAVRLLQQGFPPDDVCLVDAAGGFGGTWYWNRYPGLMCDVESSIYMPLLEETGHVPENRYAYGPELRRHADRIADRWRLDGRARFRTEVRALAWDEGARRWRVDMVATRGRGRSSALAATAQFVVLANGVLNHPKAPRLPGLEAFGRPMMHTARWDYAVSGGSPDDGPDGPLPGLAGKRVGIVGTGATAVQCVPRLARWAAELLVFQRTPSAVDERGQRPMTADEWREVTRVRGRSNDEDEDDEHGSHCGGGGGWWRARNASWSSVLAGLAPRAESLVKDAWTTIDSYRYLIGTPHPKPLTADQLPAHVASALALDAPRAERLRRRVDQTVTRDRATAEALEAWYPSFCKRPCFHDDYLAAFNLAHVRLVDTRGRGIEHLTATGVVAGGREHELDVLVWATGFRAPVADRAEPGGRSNASVVGRDGLALAVKWRRDGPATLHGLLTRGFPNLLLAGPSQVGASANWVFVLDVLARHAAHVVAEAVRRAADEGGARDRVVFEAGRDAEEAWAREVASWALWMAPLAVCGPSYLNNEGARESPEEAAKTRRAASYAPGILAFDQVLESWRRQGGLEGLEVSW